MQKTKSIDMILKKIIEFDDGSEWTLSKCLTHANRTATLFKKLGCSGVQVSKDIDLTLEQGILKIPYR